MTWIQVMVTVLRKMRRHGGKLLLPLLLPCDVKLTLRGVGRNERMVLTMLQIAGFVRVPPDPGSRLDVRLNSCLGLCLPQLCFLVTQEFLRVVVSRRLLLRWGREDRQWRGPMRTR